MHKVARLIACGVLGCSLLYPASRATALAQIKLIGRAQLAGDSADHSGLNDVLEGGFPHNRLGGISAIEYLGQGDQYLLVSDRGPADGATNYRCRFHLARLVVDLSRSPAVSIELLSTTFLRTESGDQLVGDARAIDNRTPPASLRFDPEAIRSNRRGSLFISDEYGPSIYQFDLSGKRMAMLNVPARFQIAHLAADPLVEAGSNRAGRQTNGGLEGLAIVPDGTKLYAAMQRPLIQDSRGGAEPGQKRVGTNTRIIELDLARGTTRELLYPLADTTNGVSEILAVNSHEFLMLERDGRPGPTSTCKKLFRIDIEGASDLSREESLPAEGVPANVRPVRKSQFLDLLAPEHGLAREEFPEKIEGLAFGPDLPDGRRLLIVAADNDFRSEAPIQFYAFAITRAELPEFGW